MAGVIDGAFIKQFAKACSTEDRHKDTILESIWFDNGKLYASDTVRMYRLTLNGDTSLGALNGSRFRFPVEACKNAKRGKFSFNTELVGMPGQTYHTIELENSMNADKLFNFKADDDAVNTLAMNAKFMTEVAELAEAAGKNHQIHVEITGKNKPILFWFDTDWGICDCIIMPVRIDY